MGKVLKVETPPLAAGQIEIWKKIVDVQQHFNDLELRIRNYALIVTGAFLGLGGYAIKDGGMIAAWGMQISVAGLVVCAAIVPLLAFYFMDRLWYHRLLEGAVAAGVEAESALKTLGYKVDLGSKISEKSPIKLWIVGWKVRSANKMDAFYALLLLTLAGVAACLAFAVRPQPPTGAHAAQWNNGSSLAPTPEARQCESVAAGKQAVSQAPAPAQAASAATAIVPAVSAHPSASAPTAEPQTVNCS